MGRSYATPDSGRHTLTAEKIEMAADSRSLRISVKELKPGYVYSVSAIGRLGGHG